MTRSRKRKLQRSKGRWAGLPLASAVLASGGVVQAQQAGDQGVLEEVVVTAQKRSEDLQKVPISLQVLGSEKLEQNQVTSFDDYAKLLPSVSFASLGPSQSEIFFRGVSSGPSGLHAGSLPTSGLYLDEIPVTTIAGALDIHVYDIARVEALSGPQGTLYGASSLSGTMRIITNKPDPSAFSAGYDVKGTKWGKGDGGGSLEGFVNIPINDKAAVRLVGFYEYDGGYINNVPASNTFYRPVSDALPTTTAPGQPCPAGSLPGLTCHPITVTNADVVRSNVNAIKTYGGRAALKVDLNDNWTITPQLLYQHQDANGNFSFDPKAGDLNVGDFTLGRNRDQWYQSALTVEGKVSNFDLTYTGGWFERKTDNVVDYSQYSVAYDRLSLATPYYASYVSGFTDKNGNLIDPTQHTSNHDKYTKMSHEFRISTPQDQRIRGVMGAFYQRQTDNIRAEFRLDEALGSFWTVDGQPGIIYLSQQDRTDRDYALFTEWNGDLTDKLKLTAGIRKFWVKNTLYGFFGFNGNLSSAGEAKCFTPIVTDQDRPCVNTDKKVVESGETHKINLQYQIDSDRMVYTTYSTGFRPGGNNRRVEALTYGADQLTNVEIGWKTAWFDRRLRWNGAVFTEKWKGAQTGIQGQSGITSFVNAGDARINGWEGDITLVPVDNLTVAASWTHLWKLQTTTDFCKPTRVGAAVTVCDTADLDAPAGTQLPITPKFKGNVSARYRFAVGGWDSFAQVALSYQGSSKFSLEQPKNEVVGDVPSYATVDVSVGTGKGNWKAELFVNNIADKRGELVRNTECADALFYCDQNYRVYPTKPRLFGLKFGQKF